MNRRTDRWSLKIFLPRFRILSEILTDFRILQLQRIEDSFILNWAWILVYACNQNIFARVSDSGRKWKGGFVYVIGLHAVQFGNNWIKKFRGQPKLDEAVGRVQFGCQRNFLRENISKLDIFWEILFFCEILYTWTRPFVVEKKKKTHTHTHTYARSKKDFFSKCHSNYSLQVNKRTANIAVSYFGILLPNKILKAPSMIWTHTVLQVKTAVSSTKNTKQQRKYLI